MKRVSLIPAAQILNGGRDGFFGSAAWLLCLPFQRLPFHSRRRFPFLFDYSVTNIDLSQSSRKMPATARKAVLTLPLPGKAHTGPQRASHRRGSLSPLVSEANSLYACKTFDKLWRAEYNIHTCCSRKRLGQHIVPSPMPTCAERKAIHQAFFRTGIKKFPGPWIL